MKEEEQENESRKWKRERERGRNKTVIKRDTQREKERIKYIKKESVKERNNDSKRKRAREM